MKKLIILIVVFSGFYISGFAQKIFSLKGNIKGLQIGDTLTFKPVLFNDDKVYSFFIIVEEQDNFYYQGAHAHSQYYEMVYKPISKKKIPSLFTSKRFLITEGSLVFSGTVNNIYTSIIEGSVYDNPYLKKAYIFQSELNSRKNENYVVFNNTKLQNSEQESFQEKELELKYKEEDDQLSLLWQEFDTNNLYSEYRYVRLLERLKDMSPEEISNVIAQMEIDNTTLGYYNSSIIRHVFNISVILDKLTGYWELAEGFKALIIQGESLELVESLYTLLFKQMRQIQQLENNIKNYVELFEQQFIEIQSVIELIK